MTGIGLFRLSGLSKRGALLEQPGRSRSERGAGFSEARASLFVMGFEKTATAWLAKRSRAAALLSVSICVIRG